MKKKNIIVWSIVVGVFLTIVAVCSLVFTLSKIEYQLTAQISDISRSRLFANGQTTSSVQNAIKVSAQFNKGGNLLFMEFEQNIQNIEKANPFVKVDKIVRRFPNKITVYYSEREAVALVPVTNVVDTYYVVDTSLKVLDIISSNDTSYNLPIVDYYGSTFTAKKGEFLDNSALKSCLSTFVSGAFSANGEQNALYEDVMGKSTKIQFYTETQTGDLRCKYTVQALNYSLITIDVWDINVKFFDKIAYSWKVYLTNVSKREETDEENLKVYISGLDLMVVDSASQEILPEDNID